MRWLFLIFIWRMLLLMGMIFKCFFLRRLCFVRFVRCCLEVFFIRVIVVIGVGYLYIRSVWGGFFCVVDMGKIFWEL